MNADTLAGIAMPAWALSFNSLETVLNDDTLSDADALVGIAMAAMASEINSINTLMNAEALAGFAPKGPADFLEVFS